MLTTAALAGALLAASALPASVAGADDGRLSLAELRAQYADPAGKYVTLGDTEVYFKDEGQGPVLLMVHGSAGTLRTWDGVAAILSARYRVIRYDIPPQGLSGPLSDAEAGRLRPVDVAEQLLERLGVSRATVIGVSSGGTLGVFLAAERPDLVERLVLANTPSDPVPTTGLKQSPALEAEQRKAEQTGVRSREFWDAFLDFYSGVPARVGDSVRQAFSDMNRREPERNALSLVARVADHDRAVRAMGTVTAPTLLIWGARDELLPPSAAATLAGYLTHAQVSTVLLPDVGHFPPIEAPARFAQLLSAYIEAATPPE